MILTWNSRGIAHKGFSKNLLLHLIRTHHPSMVLLIELCSSLFNTIGCLERPPFDERHIAEARGLSGGLALLWHSSIIDFTSVATDMYTIHGIIKGNYAKDGGEDFSVSPKREGHLGPSLDRCLESMMLCGA
ncbi:uncharacterized protein LOC110715473 [Chenopodium quinoa]|uniref:uncharacterized protein LOC110715473 n=1 Tax=Chenopodium quinoa TaxID=63459 RepID=UPI000B76DA2B|nr:uncharacterized protein LOC110715473 [Chenopodium quinoa]